MKNFINIVFFCLVFLISLFLFRAIFPALGTALGFLLTTALFDHFKQKPAFLFFVKLAANLFIMAILVLVVYILIYLPFELQITEIWMFTPQIHPVINTFFIVSLAMIFELINLQKSIKSKLFLGFLGVFVLYSGFVYKEYRQQKLKRESLPKIYEVSREWGPQAWIIKVEGVNFVSAGRHGKLFLDDQEMLVKLWKENLIKAEAQVPKRFGWVDLYLARNDKVISNKIPFEIEDPGKIGKEK